jgi:hypothetical protein
LGDSLDDFVDCKYFRGPRWCIILPGFVFALRNNDMFNDLHAARGTVFLMQ